MSIKEHPPQQQIMHVPVLLDSALEQLNPKPGENYLDLTAGYGGHASSFLNITGNYADSVLVDRDECTLKYLRPLSEKGAKLINADFVTATKQLVKEGRQFDIVMVDLGVSSPQLDQSQRGFSFTNNGPLDMRMDRRQELTAAKLINIASREEMAHIINQYGEEPINLARKIAAKIAENRPLSETKKLADLVTSVYRGRRGKTHPATRTFQAFRIAVNDELGQIENLLPLLPKLLKKGGRVGIISFHSLEDRLVKRFLKEQVISGFEAELTLPNKKPIFGKTDDVHNPQSRSSKLRVAVKK